MTRHLDLTDLLFVGEAVTQTPAEGLASMPGMHRLEIAALSTSTRLAEDPDASVSDLAATLCHALVEAGLFPAAELAVAWVAARAFLDRNGVSVAAESLDDQEVFKRLQAVRTGTLTLDELARWIESLAEKPSGTKGKKRSPENQSALFQGSGVDRSPVIYVASALSALDEAERHQMDAWTKVIKDALLDEGQKSTKQPWDVTVHSPFEQSAPWRRDGRQPAEIYDLNTRFLWSEVDGLILLAWRGGSIGAGQELAWAGSMRLPVLALACDDEPVSRQLEGAAGEIALTVERFKNAEDLSDRVRRWLVRHRPKIEDRHRLRRIQRQRLLPAATALAQRFATTEEADLERIAALSGLTIDRISRLARDPDALLAASLSEVLALSTAFDLDFGAIVSPAPRSLSESHLAALGQAATENQWQPQEVLELVEVGQRQLATGMVMRLGPSSPQWWEDLKDRL